MYRPQLAERQTARPGLAIADPFVETGNCATGRATGWVERRAAALLSNCLCVLLRRRYCSPSGSRGGDLIHARRCRPADPRERVRICTAISQRFR